MKQQLTDEDNAGELYETAKKLLQEERPESFTPGSIVYSLWKLDNDEERRKLIETAGKAPMPEDYAILEKIASDERSHKILLRVLTERLCP